MTNREIAEMIAKFRTHPSLNWEPLADDIETVLNAKDKSSSAPDDDAIQTAIRHGKEIDRCRHL